MKQNIKMGRKPLGDKPMTAAQRKQRQRDKMKAAGIKMANVTLTTYTQEQLRRYCELTGIPESVQMSVIASQAMLNFAEYIEKNWDEIGERTVRLKAE